MNIEKTPLPEKGRRLLEAIYAFPRASKVIHTKPAAYPTYGVLYHAVVPNSPTRVRFVGHNLRKKGMDDLSEWTMANETLPKVTGLIVDATTRRPGEDFFPSYDKIPITDDASWQEESTRVISCAFPTRRLPHAAKPVPVSSKV